MCKLSIGALQSQPFLSVLSPVLILGAVSLFMTWQNFSRPPRAEPHSWEKKGDISCMLRLPAVVMFSWCELLAHCAFCCSSVWYKREKKSALRAWVIAMFLTQKQSDIHHSFFPNSTMFNSSPFPPPKKGFKKHFENKNGIGSHGSSAW